MITHVHANDGRELKTLVHAENFTITAVQAEECLEVALKDGYIPHRDDLFLIHGPGGVGKSSLISMFQGKERDLARISTALTAEPLHLCPVRDVSTSTFTGQWEMVNIDRQARMVAHTSRHLVGSAIEKIDKPGEAAGTERKDQAFLASTPKKKNFAKLKHRLLSGLSKLVKKSQKAAEPSLGDDPDNIESLLAGIKEDLQDIMSENGDLTDLLMHYSIRLLDSGGQPQFHEVVSIILPAVTAIISVFKLSEHLNVHGEVVFYKDGVQANDPYMSYLTNEQVIRHDLLAIQSEANHSGEAPNLALVGTFLDQHHTCAETPDEKDEQLDPPRGAAMRYQ